MNMLCDVDLASLIVILGVLECGGVASSTSIINHANHYHKSPCDPSYNYIWSSHHDIWTNSMAISQPEHVICIIIITLYVFHHLILYGLRLGLTYII